jgi:pyruvate/2-oxoglutarate dehydrogenase complex dihydrolipoamide dehydrogenase (E3) component
MTTKEKTESPGGKTAKPIPMRTKKKIKKAMFTAPEASSVGLAEESKKRGAGSSR